MLKATMQDKVKSKEAFQPYESIQIQVCESEEESVEGGDLSLEKQLEKERIKTKELEIENQILKSVVKDNAEAHGELMKGLYQISYVKCEIEKVIERLKSIIESTQSNYEEALELGNLEENCTCDFNASKAEFQNQCNDVISRIEDFLKSKKQLLNQCERLLQEKTKIQETYESLLEQIVESSSDFDVPSS